MQARVTSCTTWTPDRAAAEVQRLALVVEQKYGGADHLRQRQAKNGAT
jgi:hypothetical protein